MSLAAHAVNKRVFTAFATAVALIAGVASYFSLGQLEDPEFTVKNAVVVTPYPGASPRSVELEVTEVIERTLQEMPEIKEIASTSRGGVSSVKLTIKGSIRSEALPQIWDVVRKKVADAEPELPPGAGPPVVVDEIGDVFGFLFALYADGVPMAELERFADDIKRELAVLPGVAKIELWGVRPQAVYLEVSPARLAQLGLTPADFQSALGQQNAVVDAGGVALGPTRMRFDLTGDFESVEEIGELAVRGRLARGEAGRRLLRVRDVAEIRRGYAEPAAAIMRYNGYPAIGIAVSNAPGVNIVDVGRRIDARLAELRAELPIGVEVGRISWQSEQVASAVRAFMVSLAQAVAIVVGVLWIAMGLRSSIIVGLTGLVIVIITTFLVMAVIGEDLHRMSLGALIVAMGMMVDNAIVVADGAQVRMQQGMDRVRAAVDAAVKPSMPLLGATVVAVMAFYPIAASTESAGEYCAALFSIAGVSLLISWVLAMTVAPLMCIAMLPKPTGDAGDPYAGWFFRGFRGLLRLSMRLRYGVVAALAVVLVASVAGFRYVDQMFFPASDRAQFMVDLWLPEGSRIEETDGAIARLESQAAQTPGVVSVSTFIGKGPPRFYLPVEPEASYSSYGQLIVNVENAGALDPTIDALQRWADENLDGGTVITRKYGLGPYKSWPVDVKLSGPVLGDPAELRRISETVLAVFRDSPHAKVVRTDWRDRVPRVRVAYEQANARWTGVGRTDIGAALRRSYDGAVLGVYREEDKLLPIIVRHREPARSELGRDLGLLQVRGPLSDRSVPLSQVARTVSLAWEDPLVWRFNRRPTIAVQAVPTGLAADLLADVRARVDAIELPPGYTLMWDGEYRSSRESQASLLPGVIPMVIIMAVVVVGLFNAYRPPLIVACVVPFALVGVSVGLIVTGQPFGFVALLGAMSLAGMMIKNAIVLLDEINTEKDAGRDDYTAVMNAACSRLRPVMLAAGTTVLGVIPLLSDVFWVAMAVVIMFGLTIGAALTMVLVPVLYAIFYRVRVPAGG